MYEYSKQKLKAISRPDHPAAKVVSEFEQMRDRCRHYRGFKKHENSLQCTHPDAEREPNWCVLHKCPLLEERSDWAGVGPG